MSVIVDVPEPNSQLLVRPVAGHVELTGRLVDGKSVAFLMTPDQATRMCLQIREILAYIEQIPVTEVVLEQTP